MVTVVGRVSKTQGLRKARMKASVAVTTGGVVVMVPVMAMGAPMVLVQKLVSSPHPVWLALCCNPAYTSVFTSFLRFPSVWSRADVIIMPFGFCCRLFCLPSRYAQNG
jgi:hypothetical protein